jgi:hypothetical protein
MIFKGFTPKHFFAKEGCEFEWTSEGEESFQHLNNLLTSAPILNIVDPDKDFIGVTDVYKEGLGGVLTKNGPAVCYE